VAIVSGYSCSMAILVASSANASAIEPRCHRAPADGGDPALVAERVARSPSPTSRRSRGGRANEERLERSRDRFESSLDELRSRRPELALPQARRWALPIAVAAAGLVVGLAVRRALPRRRKRLR
jgi:hypothetical protein